MEITLYTTLRIISIKTSTKYTASPLLKQGIQHMYLYSFVFQHCLGGAGERLLLVPLGALWYHLFLP